MDTVVELTELEIKKLSTPEAEEALAQLEELYNLVEERIILLKKKLNLMKLAPEKCPNCGRTYGIKVYKRLGEWACSLCGYGGTLR